MSTALDPMTAPELKWGVLAPGGIARQFADAVNNYTQASLVAVGSRTAERASEFAEEYDVARSYGSYEELVADDEVEAVYVASPHSHHKEHALMAIAAGKHVLIEKALAFDSTQVNEIFNAAQAVGVFAMEAMWTRHLPHVVELHRMIDAHELGELITVEADHGQYFDFDPNHRLFNPDLAGGALLDLGVYPLAFILDMLGKPTEVHANGQLAETGVDAQIAMSLEYPGRAAAIAHTTLWARTPIAAMVAGTDAFVYVDGNAYAPSQLQIHRRGASEVETFDGRVENGFQFQIAEAARCIAEGRTESERMSWQHSRDLMAVMDEVRTQIHAND